MTLNMGHFIAQNDILAPRICTGGARDALKMGHFFGKIPNN